ncbi:MAG: helix-turn-helix domain-containing protein [Candidatus Izemoplasmataceae bacterium]
MNKRITKKIENLHKKKEADGTMFGEIIREERMKYGFTQDSISTYGRGYPSKIEKGIIIPNFEFIKDIGDVMNLDFYQLSPTKKNTQVYKPLINYFILENEKKLNDLLRYAEGFTHKTLKTVIKFSLDVMKLRLNDMDKTIDYIIRQMEQMDSLLRQFSICLMGIYYYKTNHYTEVISILKTFEEKEDDMFKDIKGLTHHYLFLAHQALNLHANAAHYYQAAITYYRIKKAFHIVTSLEVIHLENLYHESDHNIGFILEELSTYTFTSLYDKHRYVYVDIMHQIDDIEALESLADRVITCLNEKKYTYYTYKLFILTYQRLPFNPLEKEAILKCLNQMPKSNEFTLLHYHKDSLTLKDNDLKIFLKEKALPLAILRKDIYYIKYFTECLIELSMQMHRYKEGLYHYKKYQRILKKLHSFK